MTKNQLMVTIHSKDVTEILALYRRSEIDFPPHFLVRLMHSFPMMYNTIQSKLDGLAGRGHFIQKITLEMPVQGGSKSGQPDFRAASDPSYQTKANFGFVPRKVWCITLQMSYWESRWRQKCPNSRSIHHLQGAEVRNYKKPNFRGKPALIQIFILVDLTQASTMRKSRSTAFRICVTYRGPDDFWPSYRHSKSADGGKSESVTEIMSRYKKKTRPQFSKFRLHIESAGY